MDDHTPITTDEPPPLLVRPVLPTAERIDKKKFLGVFAVLGALLILVFGLKLQRNFAADQGVQPAPLPAPHEVSGAGSLDQILTSPSSYAGIDRRPKVAPAPPVDVPPPMVALPPATPLQTTPVQAPPPAPVASPPPPPQAVPQASKPAAAPPAPKPAPKRWLFADLRNAVASSPFPDIRAGSAEGGRARDVTNAGEPLIRAARQEKPLDPARVLYRSQVISGILLQEMNSDIPGQVRIMVTQPVTDRLHQGQVLIPQASILLGVQDKTPTFGQNRLAVTIEEVHTPQGDVIALPGQLADRQGATGATGKVNHHYGAIGVAAVLSAALNVGARSLTGEPAGFQPSIAQDMARDTGASINKTAQSIVEKTLTIPPRITLKAGTPVTIQLANNLAFPAAMGREGAR